MGTLIAEIVAFVVVAFVLYRYVWPFLKPMMDKRQDAVAQQVEESEEAARKLAEAEARYESAVAEARDEAARIRDDARADSQRIREELRDQADREVERIRQRGEEQLAAQRDQIVRRLRVEIGGLSMQLAERIVAESLDSDERRGTTVDGFLDELDEMSTRAGQDRARAAVHGAGSAHGGGAS